MDFQILFVFKVGHSVQKKPKPLFNRTHHWRCYVDSWSPRYPLSAFVKKVTFNLHDTFENPRQVVRQAPFAIEEDGFGNFRLQIEVDFLDCVTTFHYDLTLFDNYALHAYRTVGIEPVPEDWENLVQLGGIVIPRDNNPSDMHKVVQIIQSCQHVEQLHPFSFFPHLEPKSDNDSRSPSSSSTVSTTTRHVEFDNLSPDRPENTLHSSQSRHYESRPHPTVPVTDQDQTQFTSTVSAPHPLPQKHKKKLQLLHEAQLLLEDAQKQQSQWASRSDGFACSQYNMLPLSPNIPCWPSKSSPMKNSRGRMSKDLDLSKTNSSPMKTGPCSSTPVKPERSSPSKRIVLKLSLRASGNQLSVPSPKTEQRETSEERRERRRRKRERKLEQLQKHQSLLQDCPVEQPQPASISTSAAVLSEVSPSNVIEKLNRKQIENLASSSSQAKEETKSIENSMTIKFPPYSPLDVPNVSPSGSSLKHELERKSTVYSPQKREEPVASHFQTDGTPDRLLRSSIERDLFGSDDDIPATSGDAGLLSPHTLTHSPDKCADRSHLLLDTLHEEFGEALSRSLFSQCHDSTTVDSPSVDLFGDETLSDPALLDDTRHYHYRRSPTGIDASKPYDQCDWPTRSHSNEHSEAVIDKSHRSRGSAAVPSHHSNGDEDVLSESSKRKNNEVSGKQRLISSNTDVFMAHSNQNLHKDRVSSIRHKKQSQSDYMRAKSEKRSKNSHIPPCDESGSSSKSTRDLSHKHSDPVSSHPCSSSDEDVPISKSRKTETVNSKPPNNKSLPIPGCKKESPSYDVDIKGNLTSGFRDDIKTNVLATRSASPPKSTLQHKTTASSAKSNATLLESDSQSGSSAISKDLHLKHNGRNRLGTNDQIRLPVESRNCLSDGKVRSTECLLSDKRDKRQNVLKEMDIELSSLSSGDSSTSSPTPPMSSCNSLIATSMDDLKSTDSVYPNPSKTVSKSSSPKPTNEHSASKRTKPKKTSSIKPNSTISVPSPITLEEPTKPIESTSQAEPARITTSNQPKYSNQQLEHLFDRLLRLEQPHLAIRMGEILLQYLTPRSPKATEIKGNIPGSDKSQRSNHAVKILNKGEPRVFAFNLRRLPVACLDQLSQLIAEDEALSVSSGAEQQDRV